MSIVSYALAILQRMYTVYLSWATFIGKLVSASRIVSPLPHERRLSATQRCNEDVLDEIFAELPCSALASAALVCRGWLFPARVRLYRDLFLNNFGPPHSDNLAEILPNQPLLRSLIRRPVLRYMNTGRPCPTLFDWIALLPEHSFQSVEFKITESCKRMPLPTLATLLNFPAVRTAPRLIVRCRTFITPDRLDQVLRMPCLESLSLMISEGTAMHLKDITVFPQSLRRLSIKGEIFSPLLAKLLHGLPVPLERFDLQCNRLKLYDMALLCHALKQHSSRLRHLVLLGRRFSVPFCLDELVASFPHLETLLLSDGLYSPDLFAYLPPTISSLTLCTPRMLPRSDVDEYVSALQSICGRLPLLRSLSIAGWEIDPREYEPLARVCDAQGITLRGRNILSIDILGDTFIRKR